MEDLSPVPTVKQEAKVMSFYDALKELVENKRRITRLDWNSNEEYGYLAEDGVLQIRTKGKDHRWILSDGDILATDFCLLPEQS